MRSFQLLRCGRGLMLRSLQTVWRPSSSGCPPHALPSSYQPARRPTFSLKLLLQVPTSPFFQLMVDLQDWFDEKNWPDIKHPPTTLKLFYEVGIDGSTASSSSPSLLARH